MKTILLISTTIFVLTTQAQTYVPDDYFENYLETHDASGAVVSVGDPTSMGNGIANDDYVTTANINTVTDLNLWNKFISDLTGIEDFTALQTLECGANYLTNLDVTQNTGLTSLRCTHNNLTSLDVTQNIALTYLDFSNNDVIPNIDLSQNIALTYLKCDYNQMAVLDVSQNVALEELYCLINSLTSLDVSQNIALIKLDCFANNLSTLDVSQNTALTHLNAAYNQLTTIDTSQNTDLTYYNCYHNSISNLDVSQNTSLLTLSCSETQITTLDLSQNAALTDFSCNYSAQLVSLDFSLNAVLTKVYCYGNAAFTDLNIKNGNNTAITDFKAYSNPNLTCIEVDDAVYSTANWTNIDPQTSFSENCSPIGVEEDFIQSYRAYPNPASNRITISGDDVRNYKYQIFDILGKELIYGDLMGKNTIDIAECPDGIYFLNIYNEFNSKTIKFLKN